MKKISVIVPSYNDEKSIQNMWQRVKKIFNEDLIQYDYELIFVDDCSNDNTWEEIKNVCAKDCRCKGVHNLSNFGPNRNIFQSLKYASGNAAFLLYGDLQQPPEALIEFIKYYEAGYNSVIGVHQNSYDSKVLKLMRHVYYWFIDKTSNGKLINNFDGFGLYDHFVLNAIKCTESVQASLPGLLSEFGGKIKSIQVTQNKSERGYSNFNFFKKYDVAMVNITSHNKYLLRIVTFLGIIISFLSCLFALTATLLKIFLWDDYPMGVPSIIFGIFFLGGVQLFYLGIIGEYIMCINERILKKPTVVVDKTINIEILSN